jgi:hypothetical protein
MNDAQLRWSPSNTKPRTTNVIMNNLHKDKTCKHSNSIPQRKAKLKDYVYLSKKNKDEKRMQTLHANPSRNTKGL